MARANRRSDNQPTPPPATAPHATHDWRIFNASFFFVLGFSTVFALVGVLLQTILSSVSYGVGAWLGRIGGIIIIFFGLFLTGLIKPAFLLQDHKLTLRRKFKSVYLTSFVFGAAFAVGWTPCVTAALGSILGLAASNPSSAFLLLVAYTLGVGLPFLVVGYFSSRARPFISRIAPALETVNVIFGVILIILGILVFTGTLNEVANLAFTGPLAVQLGSTIGENISGLSVLNLAIAFIAGLISFLSPCVLPLLPGFLTYITSVAATSEGTSGATSGTDRGNEP